MKKYEVKFNNKIMHTMVIIKDILPQDTPWRSLRKNYKWAIKRLYEKRNTGSRI